MTKVKRQRATLSAWDERYLELGKAVWTHYRMRCHQAVQSAIRWGHMKALPDGETQCSYCKSAPAMAWEHRDYTDPLNVVPACDRWTTSARNAPTAHKPTVSPNGRYASPKAHGLSGPNKNSQASPSE
jgi:hypothetical protein